MQKPKITELPGHQLYKCDCCSAELAQIASPKWDSVMGHYDKLDYCGACAKAKDDAIIAAQHKLYNELLQQERVFKTDLDNMYGNLENRRIAALSAGHGAMAEAIIANMNVLKLVIGSYVDKVKISGV